MMQRTKSVLTYIIPAYFALCHFVHCLSRGMCIAVLVANFSPRFPLLIFHNREENFSRPTSSLRLRGDVLGAIDLKAKGVAAVGMNVKSGKFGMLTNCRFASTLNPAGQSRGTVLQNLLSDDEKIDWTTPFQGDFHLYEGGLFLKKSEPVFVKYFTSIDKVGGDERTVFVDSPNHHLQVHVRMNEHPSNVSEWKKLAFLQGKLQAELEQLSSSSELDEIGLIVTKCLSDSTELDFSTNLPEKIELETKSTEYTEKKSTDQYQLSVNGEDGSERTDNGLRRATTVEDILGVDSPLGEGGLDEILAIQEIDDFRSPGVDEFCESPTETHAISSSKPPTYEWSSLPPETEAFVQKHILVPKIIFENESFGTVSQTLIVVDCESQEVHYKYRTVFESDGEGFSAWDHRVIPY